MSENEPSEINVVFIIERARFCVNVFRHLINNMFVKFTNVIENMVHLRGTLMILEMFISMCLPLCRNNGHIPIHKT